MVVGAMSCGSASVRITGGWFLKASRTRVVNGSV